MQVIDIASSRASGCGSWANGPLYVGQVIGPMPLVFPVLGACINRGAVPLDRGRRPRRPARTLQDADLICSRCGTKASRADQGVCPTTSAALPTVEKRVALACQAAPHSGKPQTEHRSEFYGADDLRGGVTRRRGGRMPPRMGAWQPGRLRYGAATKCSRKNRRGARRNEWIVVQGLYCPSACPTFFHGVSRAEGPSQRTVDFRQTAPEIHVRPRIAAYSWPSALVPHAVAKRPSRKCDAGFLPSLPGRA